jgi:hypothetical protein
MKWPVDGGSHLWWARTRRFRRRRGILNGMVDVASIPLPLLLALALVLMPGCSGNFEVGFCCPTLLSMPCPSHQFRCILGEGRRDGEERTERERERKRGTRGEREMRGERREERGERRERQCKTPEV